MFDQVLAYAYRPATRGDDSFAGQTVVPISAPSMFVMRWQWVSRAGAIGPQPSQVLSVMRFAYDSPSGRVFIDARRDRDCNTAAWDLALPVETRSTFPQGLDPARNRTAHRLADIMVREVERAVREDEALPGLPVLPEFLLAFNPQRPPVFEVSPTLRSDASIHLGLAPHKLTEDDLRAHWDRRLERIAGYICVRQEYLSRADVPYSVNPIDGSSPPDRRGAPDEWSNFWYYRNGRWNPVAQRPARVLARMDKVCGRRMRNPAFSVLMAHGLVPEGLTYPAFMAGDVKASVAAIREAIASRIDGGEPELAQTLIAAMRARLGRADDRATDDDVVTALENPDQVMTLSCESRVGLVGYRGRPSPESLTFQFNGGYADLFTVRGVWAERFQPATTHSRGRKKYGHQANPAARR
jgi:hypothetical protein